MANVFDQFDAPASGNVFDQFDVTPAVKPGDVEARKAQIESNPANFAGTVRPVETIGSKLASGLGNMATGIGQSIINPVANWRALLNLGTGRGSLQEMLNSPMGKTAMGVSDVVMAPTQPIREGISRGAERAQDKLLPDSPALAAGAATLFDVGGNLALDTAITAGAGAASTRVKAALPLRREQTAQVLEKGMATNARISNAAEREVAQAERVRDAQVRQIKELREKELAPVRQGEEALRANAAGARTPEFIGQKYKAETFPTKHAESREAFNDRYQALIDEGRGISTAGEAVTDQAKATLAEKGLAGTPSATRAESSAAKLQRALDVEQDVYDQIKKQLPEGFDQFPPSTQKQILDQMGLDPTTKIAEAKETATNLGDLVLERQRLKGAARAAYESGNYNLARQFDDLGKGIYKEIESVDSTFAERLRSVDQAYKNEHVPFFGPQAVTRKAADRSAETVLDKFIPTKDAPNRVEHSLRAHQLVDNPDEIKRTFLDQGVKSAEKHKGGFNEGVVKWWDKYADTKTDDKVLKTWLGDDYNHMRDIVQRFRTVKPKTVDKTLSDTIAVLDKRAAERGEFALKDRDAALKKLQKDTAAQIKEITGEQMDPKRIKNYGMFLMIEGGVSQLIGSPTGTLRGLAGGLMVMSPNMLAKIINAPGGAQLIRRGLRAVPGTTQSAAVSRQLQNLSRSLSDREDEPR